MGADEELAQGFARLAGSLYLPDAEAVRGRITAAATGLVPGCEQAALSLLDRHGGIVTAAATGRAAVLAGEIQRDLGAGPSHDAVHGRPLCRIDDLLGDQEWPEFGRQAARQAGIRCMLAVRLAAGDDVLGALNLYASRPDALGATAVARAGPLAAHAALALAAADCRRSCAELREALRSSRSIGIALGIIMARHRVTSRDAFDVLRRCAQRQHRKVRDVAADIELTGEVPEEGRRRSGATAPG
ncbi:GAF and ANTAR domain-containing protein [Actinoplanes sp. NPDC049599]|uniref:GAF and ANTAR domain-containing protein n=1 Tax=Actinoplanes sp. NPDC049599 TaxID=3363903 RepID=UPI0037B55829